MLYNINRGLSWNWQQFGLMESVETAKSGRNTFFTQSLKINSWAHISVLVWARENEDKL